MTELFGSAEQVLSGEARCCVICADNLDVMRGMPDKTPGLVTVTDCPYAVGKKIANDSLPWEQWLPWIDERHIEMARISSKVFDFLATNRVLRFIRESSFPPNFEIVWHKPMMLHDTSLNGSPFLAHSERILYWGPMSPKEAGKLGYDSVACNALWPRERRKMGIDHPTPKPEPLIRNSLKYWTKENDIVFDPFCGSGTHGEAALNLGRRYIGIDIDQRWVDATIERLTAVFDYQTVAGIRIGQEGLFT